MKKMWILLLAAALLLTGCGKKEADVEQTLFCMDTAMQLQLWGEESETAAQQLQTLLQELDAQWSPVSEDSVIPHLELYGLEFEDVEYVEDPETGVVIEVPLYEPACDFTAEQVAVVEKAIAMQQRTNGAFDPQLGGLVQLWGFTSGAFHVPTKNQAAEAAQLATWDLSAAIKGYAGDRAVELLQTLKVDCALLNLGGNVQTYGTKPDGKPWRIGVQNPQVASESICTLEVTGTTSVVTSGSYQRYFDQNGIRYHHILDPQTGFPVDNGLASVTVICADGMTADCLSTALFVMGYDEAVRHWQESSDFEMILVTETGKVYATQGVTVTDGTYEVIFREN